MKKVLSVLTALTLMAPLAAFAAEGTVTINTDKAKAEAALHRPDAIQAAGDSQAQAATAKLPPSNTPNRIIVTLTDGDPATTRAFNWYSSERRDAFVLLSTKPDMSDAVKVPASTEEVESHYAERDDKGYFLFRVEDKKSGKTKKFFTDEGRAKDWDFGKEAGDGEAVNIGVVKVTETANKAIARNLTPDTTYYYQVGSKDHLSDVGSFKTAPSDVKSFSFLHYTDTQNAYWNEHVNNEARYAADTLKHMLDTDPSASFVLHTGDLVEISEIEDEWVDLFGQSRPFMMKTTFMPLAGNHDEYGLNYEQRFFRTFNNHVNVPAAGPIDGGSYYAVTYGPVHFINLNTNDYKNEGYKALGEAQLQWAKDSVTQARAKGAKWVIMNYHKPLFSKSYHSLQDQDVANVRDEFMKLIDDLDVDLALQGHDHVLSRTKSLVYVPKDQSVFNAKVAEETQKTEQGDWLTNPKGTTFILPNTGGTKAYDAIYDKGLDHIKKVRPKLSWLTPELLEEYNGLFAFGGQPAQTDRFKKSHSNFRDSTVQNFARYSLEGNKLTCELYQVEGELPGKRTVKKVDSFTIEKN